MGPPVTVPDLPVTSTFNDFQDLPTAPKHDFDTARTSRMIASRLLRPSLTSRTMASAYSALDSAASAPSSAGYQTSANGATNDATIATSSEFTLTALSRWSVANNQLPAVDQIRALHVYDFDNTRATPDSCSQS